MTVNLFNGYPEVFRSALVALLPLLAILLVSQATLLRLPLRQLLKMSAGIILSFFGLTLFLQGVNVGFIPVGSLMGYQLADLPHNWILVPIGFLMGFAVTLAEPAVHVLTQQIERVSSGSIPRKGLLIVLSFGVALSTMLAMLKLLLGLSLWYIIVPGYLVAIVLAKFVKPDFVAIAFDSGGVATGTMTATVMLSLAIGVATRLDNTNPLLDGFGIISLVALTPIILVLAVGLIIDRKEQDAPDNPSSVDAIATSKSWVKDV